MPLPLRSTLRLTLVACGRSADDSASRFDWADVPSGSATVVSIEASP